MESTDQLQTNAAVGYYGAKSIQEIPFKTICRGEMTVNGSMMSNELWTRRGLVVAGPIPFLIHILFACMGQQIEGRRKLQGLQVVEAYRGSVVISGRPLLLVAKRCGLSFKFIGYDQQTSETYVGYVYEPAVRQALKAQGGQAKPWEKDRVVEFLVSMLGLVDALPALSADLETFNKSRTLVLHVDKGSLIGTHGKRQTSFQRVLRDEMDMYRSYIKIEEKKRRRRDVRGRPDSVQVLKPWDIRPRDGGGVFE